MDRMDAAAPAPAFSSTVSVCANTVVFRQKILIVSVFYLVYFCGFFYIYVLSSVYFVLFCLYDE